VPPPYFTYPNPGDLNTPSSTPMHKPTPTPTPIPKYPQWWYY
jgi:hypothetical protein